MKLYTETWYELLKDGNHYANAWYVGFDGDYYVFADGNVRYHVADLNKYAIATII